MKRSAGNGKPRRSVPFQEVCSLCALGSARYKAGEVNLGSPSETWRSRVLTLNT